MSPQGWTFARIFLGILAWHCSGPALETWGQEKLLRWRLRESEAVRVDMQQVITAEQNVFGKSMNSTADMSLQMLWEVKSVNASGVAEIEQSIERVRMKMTAPGGEPVEFDTAGPDEPKGMAKQFRDSVQPMIGLQILQQMTNRGEILDARLSEASEARLRQANPQGPQTMPFSKEDIRAMLAQSAAVLPEHAVAPGATWAGVSESKSPFGSLVMNLKYTYAGPAQREGRTLERIVVDIDFDISPEAADNGLQVAVKDQQSRGVMWFDVAQGRFVETQLDQKMTLMSSFGDTQHEQRLVTKMRISFRDAKADRVSAHANGARSYVGWSR